MPEAGYGIEIPDKIVSHTFSSRDLLHFDLVKRILIGKEVTKRRLLLLLDKKFSLEQSEIDKIYSELLKLKKIKETKYNNEIYVEWEKLTQKLVYADSTESIELDGPLCEFVSSINVNNTITCSNLLVNQLAERFEKFDKNMQAVFELKAIKAKKSLIWYKIKKR